MIDFNGGTEMPNKFLGSEKKMTLLYNNEVCMIKFPDPIRAKNNDLSYMNNQFSEHIGCRIFDSCGFQTQETALGTYTDKTGKTKIVVGCKDFTQDGSALYEFSKLSNAVALDVNIKTSFESVGTVIRDTPFIKDKESIESRFWDMFVVDALLGNADRHFDNWGISIKNGEVSFAPIYDCGSSLGALLSDERMLCLLENESEFGSEEYNVKSCYLTNGKKTFYHEIFKSPPDDLKEAIKRTVPKIDMERIKGIVLGTEGISDIRKEYLTKSLTVRYERILAPALKRILKQERSAQSLGDKLTAATKTLAESAADKTDASVAKKPKAPER
jgi:hypothetical protein